MIARFFAFSHEGGIWAARRVFVYMAFDLELPLFGDRGRYEYSACVRTHFRYHDYCTVLRKLLSVSASRDAAQHESQAVPPVR